jgi:hypothetical protein
MSRAPFITIHMYLSAFFAVFVLMVASSGGLYLLGYKGSMDSAVVHTEAGNSGLAQQSGAELEQSVVDLLVRAGVEDYSFEYVKVNGSTLDTRPTSRTHYKIELGDEITVIRRQPSLQSAMMELHMGHGPLAFRTFQKIFAAGMIFIILSGLWLGLSAERLRSRTLLAAGSGAALFFIAVLVL